MIAPKPVGRPPVFVTVLALYGVGAAIGTAATAGGVAMLGCGAAAIAVAALLPASWTGLRARQ